VIAGLTSTRYTIAATALTSARNDRYPKPIGYGSAMNATATATPRTAAHQLFVRLPAEVKAAGGRRTRSTSAHTDSPKITT
jgi:hypothetical protein